MVEIFVVAAVERQCFSAVVAWMDDLLPWLNHGRIL
jgi:hypothetical protein